MTPAKDTVELCELCAQEPPSHPSKDGNTSGRVEMRSSEFAHPNTSGSIRWLPLGTRQLYLGGTSRSGDIPGRWPRDPRPGGPVIERRPG